MPMSRSIQGTRSPADGENDVVAREHDRVDHSLFCLPPSSSTQSIELQSDELAVLEHEALGRMVLDDLDAFFFASSSSHGDALKYCRERRAMTLTSAPPSRRDVRQQSMRCCRRR
jgi:hypothetical protein